MKIGIISDTHNYLDPRVPELFRGVGHIIHGGDIGERDLLAQLESIAPVTAVAGNTDDDPAYPQTVVATLASLKFLVHHIVTPGAMAHPIDRRIAVESPDVVVFGHTHKPFAEKFGRTLFFNPGSAGHKRFSLPRTVALMDCGADGVRYQFVSLE